ncbi:hypothetical protein F5Y10DRAFT_92124 [Nemania abortiva]|nr:hypothetical protein F5Y10DRAFT_92124 [Nemania abortiva]
MELHNIQPKEASRIGKPERPYISSLKSYPMEPRRRPLRTYSKRASSIEPTEPAPKRRCINNSTVPSIQDQHTRPPPPSDPKQDTIAPVSEPLLTLPPTKKGTITAYFGRIIPQAPAVIPLPSSDPVSEPLSEDGPTFTPPSSPPVVTTRRRARRLKTRVVTQRIDERVASDEEEENEDDDARLGAIDDEKPSPNTSSSVLSETTPNTLNQTDNLPRSRSGDSKPQRKRQREKKTTSVQTTISLSMTEAQYTECKECGLLYNHFHPTDVKYHARRHAALRKAKLQGSVENDVAE